MQLPPTIISLNERTKQNKAKKTKSAPSESKTAKKTTVSTAPSTKVLPDPATSTSVEENQDDLSDLSSSSEDEDEVVGAVDVSEPTVPPSTKEGKACSSQKKKKTAIRELRPPRTLETTLFDRLERMYGPGIKRMLDVQYRFVPPNLHRSVTDAKIECTNK